MTLRRHTHARERGTTAIEFSFVFALLFGIFWAIVSYAMPFFLYQVMSQAVSESARYALRIDPSLNDSAIETLINNYIKAEPLAVLPTRFQAIINNANADPSTISDSLNDGISYRTLNVTLTYPGCSTTAQASCIVPALNLFGVSIPKLGAFDATATVHLGRR
ncbi:Flp pilus assembly protein TadG [Paraperlucidibaca baekdonensis]|uniref:Flp pilus assembly protein TadG n=1 Tax=Paraperlucidibaca baekdonensis TaxID=748120 RepID=A0A3E0H6Z6_9GAMM|nr:TadE family protein [Paraperlucidibaca baekdonensis]REH39038.1 Flp pilus assembly protein TadG [Paraperlucidibaca baekdonensis]